MKQYIKNPVVYMVAVPLIAALWMLYAWGWAYPASIRQWDDSRTDYAAAEKMLDEILTIEPQRLAWQQEKGKSDVFDYTNVVDQYAKQAAIAPGDYTLNVHAPSKKSGKPARSADLTVKSIGIDGLSKFLTDMLIRWPELECERLALEKLPAGKNNWKVILRLTYYY